MHWVRVTYRTMDGSSKTETVQQQYYNFHHYVKAVNENGLVLGKKWIAPGQLMEIEEVPETKWNGY